MKRGDNSHFVDYRKKMICLAHSHCAGRQAAGRACKCALAGPWSGQKIDRQQQHEDKNTRYDNTHSVSPAKTLSMRKVIPRDTTIGR